MRRSGRSADSTMQKYGAHSSSCSSSPSSSLPPPPATPSPIPPALSHSLSHSPALEKPVDARARAGRKRERLLLLLLLLPLRPLLLLLLLLLLLPLLLLLLLLLLHLGIHHQVEPAGRSSLACNRRKNADRGQSQAIKGSMAPASRANRRWRRRRLASFRVHFDAPMVRPRVRVHG